MSLLLDALKKAALEKERREGPQKNDPSDELSPDESSLTDELALDSVESERNLEISGDSDDDIQSLSLDVNFDDLEASIATNDDSHESDEDGSQNNQDDWGESNDFGEVVSLDEQPIITQESSEIQIAEQGDVESDTSPLESSPTELALEEAAVEPDGIDNTDKDTSKSVSPELSIVQEPESGDDIAESAIEAKEGSGDDFGNDSDNVSVEESSSMAQDNGGSETSVEGSEPPSNSDQNNEEKTKGDQGNNDQIHDDQINENVAKYGYTRITDQEAKVSFVQLLGRSQKAVAINRKKKRFALFAFIVLGGMGVAAYAYYTLFFEQGVVGASQVGNQYTPRPYFENPVESTEYVDNVDVENNVDGVMDTDVVDIEHGAVEEPQPPNDVLPTGAEVKNSDSVVTSVEEKIASTESESTPLAPDFIEPDLVESGAEESDVMEIGVTEPKVVGADSQNSKSHSSKDTGAMLGGKSGSESHELLSRERSTADKPTSETKPILSVKKVVSVSKPNSLKKAVSQGYQAYQQGDFKSAKDWYTKALKIKHNDRDALLGSAAVAIAQERYYDAMSFYEVLLEESPKDSIARSGLLALLTQENAGPEIFSRINLFVREHPENAYGYFLLGNYYSSQGQWLAANNSYLRALKLEPADANFSYNLGVSYEYLGDAEKALKFYRQAISRAGNTPHAFDVATLQLRVQYLEGR